MARRPGHPVKVTKMDHRTMRVANRVLSEAAQEFRLPAGLYPPASGSRRLTAQPQPLALAVLAIQLGRALELLAAEHVERARKLDGVTWEQVGEAFGVSMQSAHARYRQRS
jgi:hypothetical protein